jgi:hypothetical protein
MVREAARNPGCWVTYNKRPSFPKCDGQTTTAAAVPAAKTQTSAPAAQPVVPPSNSAPSSPSCSDITGLGGDAGPSNCTPSGTPQELANYQSSARSYLQAAQTVKQSDPSASGQAAAAAQFRKAADAFRLAGELALARVAADQAQTIETALNASPQAVPQSSPRSAGPQDQQAALPQDQSNGPPSDDQCPPAIPAKYWGDADYCAKASASCVDRGSALYGYLCFVPNKPDTSADAQDPGTAEMEKRLRSTLSKVRPRVYKPPMSPQALRSLAFTACRKKSLAEKPQCIEDDEVKTLLEPDDVARADCAKIADSIARWNQAVDASPGSDALKDSLHWVCAPDPDVRTACASITDRQAQLECVDAVYVRGPGAYGDGLRTTLQKSINDNGIQK